MPKIPHDGGRNGLHCRPREMVSSIGRSCPEVWCMVDQVRATRGKGTIPTWPDWCFLPMAAWQGISKAAIEDMGGVQPDSSHRRDAVKLAALATWRLTQGVYRFDPTLYKAVEATALDGDIPQDVLFHLPEWCVYIETQDAKFCGCPLHGFFAFLDYDISSQSTALVLVFDIKTDSTRFTHLAIPLGRGSIREAITRVIGDRALPVAGDKAAILGAVAEDVAPFVALVLYLCSENADLGPNGRRSAHPQPKRTKKGVRFFPPDRPTMWDVGVRIGAALRRASVSDTQTDEERPHAGPRPHIRRAHWHSFRTGPMKDAAGATIPAHAREVALRWLPPIPVNLDNLDDLPATIRPVV